MNNVENPPVTPLHRPLNAPFEKVPIFNLPALDVSKLQPQHQLVPKGAYTIIYSSHIISNKGSSIISGILQHVSTSEHTPPVIKKHGSVIRMHGSDISGTSTLYTDLVDRECM
eukprot:GHVR01048487.1.p1 GENE.GHVR01048487.1~~GHVR01048487.1.p1  ORF type:complete len:113 (+),score=9.18 GHVR01048487.1:83-421(+)